MKILITGTSQGIGKACAELFLQNEHIVIGFDIKPSSIQHKNYRNDVILIPQEIFNNYTENKIRKNTNFPLHIKCIFKYEYMIV